MESNEIEELLPQVNQASLDTKRVGGGYPPLGVVAQTRSDLAQAKLPGETECHTNIGTPMMPSGLSRKLATDIDCV